MAKSKASPDAAATVAPTPLSHWRWLALTSFVLLLFYWTPLLSPDATIQWNAVDLHYPAQQYFSQQMKAGHLPHWANYVLAGFPMLSDPQTGGFYPLNWPFFLLGVTPLAIQMEIAFHALIAICGAFLLLRRLTAQGPAALAGAFSYGLGGYFAAHSSHVGMMQSAALLPWLLYCYDRAATGNRISWLARAAAVAGGCFLTGSLSSGIVALLALLLFAIWRRLHLADMAIVSVAALALAAVVWLPAITFWNYTRPDNFFQPLTAGALTTLLWPNALGIFSGVYQGKGDLTQTYLYSGLLLLPLAGFALRNKGLRLPAALLVGVPLIFSLVHSADHFFAAALGLSILATYGIIEAQIHWRQQWLGLLLVALFALDLCAWNSWYNPLAYARTSYKALSGDGEEALRKLGATLPNGYRVEIPPRFALFGSMNSPLLTRVESSGGFNPLTLATWRDYRQAALRNERLIDGLSAALVVSPRDEKILGNEGVLRRAYFAPNVVGVASLDESRLRLPSLDPARDALVQSPFPGVKQDHEARVLAITVTEQGVRVKYAAASPSLLKVTNAYYPGWQASVTGQPIEVLRVDHALLGAVVPAGEHEVVFAFETKHFAAGAAASGFAALALLLLSLRREQR